MKYWINTISRDHVERGVAGGFTQAGHGRSGGLKKLSKDDWMVFYSPRTFYDKAVGEVLRNFTAIAQVADDEPYQTEVTPDWKPFRRNMKFYDCVPVPVEPFIPELGFIKDKTHWGYMFKLGLFEIPEADFKLLQSAMMSA